MVMPAVLGLQNMLALCIELPSPTRIGFWFSTEGSLTFCKIHAKMCTNYIMCKNIKKGIWCCVMFTALRKTKKIPLPALQPCPWVGTTLPPPEQLGRSRLKQRTQPARRVIDTSFWIPHPKREAPRDSWHPPNASNYKACETLTKKILSTHIKYHIINPTIKSSKTFFEMPPFPRRSITNSLAPWLRNLGKASEISSALRAAKVRSRRKLSVVWNVDDS